MRHAADKIHIHIIDIRKHIYNHMYGIGNLPDNLEGLAAEIPLGIQHDALMGGTC